MAFNECVCESDRIAEILADIRSSGYDVLLALEVTIGMMPAKTEDAVPVPVPNTADEYGFSESDREFLQTLHVTA